jgi:hypothetical protein
MGESLCELNDIFKYEELAIERDEYYTLMGLKTDVKVSEIFDYDMERKIMTGDTISVSYVEVAIVERPIGELISNLKQITVILLKRIKKQLLRKR